MSKFKAYIKDWAMAEITADLIDPKEKDALDGIRYVIIRNNDTHEFHQVKIPEGRALPLRAFKRGRQLEKILHYTIGGMEIEQDSVINIEVFSENDDSV